MRRADDHRTAGRADAKQREEEKWKSKPIEYTADTAETEAKVQAFTVTHDDNDIHGQRQQNRGSQTRIERGTQNMSKTSIATSRYIDARAHRSSPKTDPRGRARPSRVPRIPVDTPNPWNVTIDVSDMSKEP